MLHQFASGMHLLAIEPLNLKLLGPVLGFKSHCDWFQILKLRALKTTHSPNVSRGRVVVHLLALPKVMGSIPKCAAFGVVFVCSTCVCLHWLPSAYFSLLPHSKDVYVFKCNWQHWISRRFDCECGRLFVSMWLILDHLHPKAAGTGSRTSSSLGVG